MRVDDLTVEVRDRTLKRVGQVTPLHLDLKARTKWCAVGEWTLTLPGDHGMVPHLTAPGSGILLLGPDGTADNVILSGPTRTPARVRNQQNPDGTFTFNGVTDEVVLAGALAFPNPAIADPQASSQDRSNDVRTGTTEDLLRQFVSLNIGTGTAPAGRVRGLRQYLALAGASGGRGLTQQKSPRFQNLLELLQEMIAYDPSLGFRVVQVGAALQFQVLDSRDRTAFVRFDIENGTITSEEVQFAGPVVTDAIVAGQGEGTERTIVRRQDADAITGEADWGVPFETFIDQRDTDDLTELEQSGDEALFEGRGGTAVKMVPADDTTMEVGTDWRSGDTVTTVVGGVETVARVTEVAYMVTAAGVMAGAALGDVSGFTAADAESSTIENIDSRVSRLERASQGIVSVERLPRDDLRFAGTAAERDALYGVPGASVPAQVALANRQIAWWNTEEGWEESYYAVTGSAGLTTLGLAVGAPAGWYPTGAGPYCTIRPTAGVSVSTGNFISGWNAAVARRGGVEWFDTDTYGIIIKKAGRYDLSAWTIQQSGSGTGIYALRLYHSNGSTVLAAREHAAESLLGSPILTPAEYQFETTIANTGTITRLYSVAASVAVHQTAAAAAGIRGQMIARYLGPALALD